MFTCSKTYTNLPAAHRQHNHDGHCALIHGHNWGFKITFNSRLLDENGFVVDFGKLKYVKSWLKSTFDHTLLINKDDPKKDHFMVQLQGDFADIRIVPNCGAEGLAMFVYDSVCRLLNTYERLAVDGRQLGVDSVTCYEDSKNEATYYG